MDGVFDRPARRYPEVLPADDIVLARPPAVSEDAAAGSWAFYLLPALSTAGSLVFVFIYPNRWLALAAAGFAVLSGLSMLLMWRQTRRAAVKRRKRMRQQYSQYLDRQEARLAELAQKQRERDRFLYPGPEQWEDWARSGKRLWERRREDEDFLRIFLGTGRVPFCCRVVLEVGDDPYIEYEADLLKRAQDLVARFRSLEDGAVTADLGRVSTVAVRGSGEDFRAVLRGWLVQMAVCYVPADVRIMMGVQPETEQQWRWARWLPHVRVRESPGSGTPWQITDDPGIFREWVARRVTERLHRVQGTEPLNHSPEDTVPWKGSHVILVLDGWDPQKILGEAELDTLARRGAGVTLIYRARKGLPVPQWVQAVADVRHGSLGFEFTGPSGRKIGPVRFPVVVPEACERIARAISPLRLRQAGVEEDWEQVYRLSELMELRDLDSWDPEMSWRSTERAALLEVPVGVRQDGKPLVLDLKESAYRGMGPHGLVVGATGSGKSELLRTIVTGLAARHAPDTLNFVFVDFKGGAAFADFAHLPHCAGLVTNLEQDPAQIDRIYQALLGELQRRQRVLREDGNYNHIREYRRARRGLHERMILPYLLVVVDEFGELLSRRPEFHDLFLAIGRVGRSVGIHLLLATQRLDEGRVRGLEGHLRYRFCLRTFGPEESTAVLGRPDAFYLPPIPGVGYYKVDTDTFERFKAASVSEPYDPGRPGVRIEDLVKIFPDRSQVLDARPDQRSDGANRKAESRAETPAALTEMRMVVNRIRDQYRGPGARQVWLPPLPSRLSLRTVGEESGWPMGPVPDWVERQNPPGETLQVPIGLVDLPEEQRRGVLWIDFSGAQGHLAVVGAHQSGKSALLRTLARTLMDQYRPDEVQLYMVDLGGGLLRVFESAPHVGAVLGPNDKERTGQLLQLVRRWMDERERLFRSWGAEGLSSVRFRREASVTRQHPCPEIFVMIDDVGRFQSEFDPSGTELAELVSVGLHYGVHMVVTASRWADIRAKVLDHIGGRLELRLNDPAESEVGRALQALLPPDVPGRGLTREGKLFQAALPVVDGVKRGDEEIRLDLERWADRVRESWTGEPAPPVRTLPVSLRYEEIAGEDELPGVPIGIESVYLRPVRIDLEGAHPHFVVLGDSGCGKTSLLRTWIHGLADRYTPEQVQIAIVDYRRGLVDAAGLPHLFAYAYTPAMVQDWLTGLRENLAVRQPRESDGLWTRLQEGPTWTGPQYYVFIDDYDWVAGTGMSPLDPLADLLLQARDIGLHLVLTRGLGGVSGAMYDSIFRRLREMGSPHLVMAGDPGEAKMLGVPGAGYLPPGRGYLLTRGESLVLLQVALWHEDRIKEARELAKFARGSDRHPGP